MQCKTRTEKCLRTAQMKISVDAAFQLNRLLTIKGFKPCIHFNLRGIYAKSDFDPRINKLISIINTNLGGWKQ